MVWNFFYSGLRVIYLMGFFIISGIIFLFIFFHYRNIIFPNSLIFILVFFIFFYTIAIYYLKYHLPHILKEKMFQYLSTNRNMQPDPKSYFSDYKKMCGCYFDDEKKLFHIFTFIDLMQMNQSYITTHYDNLKSCNVINNKKVNIIFHQSNSEFNFYFDLDKLTRFVTKLQKINENNLVSEPCYIRFFFGKQT